MRLVGMRLWGTACGLPLALGSALVPCESYPVQRVGNGGLFFLVQLKSFWELKNC